MGFSKVYNSLQEIFPQIDARVLRAVAIEHSKDPDAAVEAVLVEIIPFFTERSRPSTPLTGRISDSKSSEAFVGVIATAQTVDIPSVNTVGSAEVQDGHSMNGGNQPSLHDADNGHNEPFYDAYDRHHRGEGNAAELAWSEEILENSMQTNAEVYTRGVAVELIGKDGVNTLEIEVSIEPNTDETISADKCPESCLRISSDNIPRHSLGTLQDEDIGNYQNTATHETISADKCPESSIKISSDFIPHHSLGTLQHGDIGINQKMNLFQETADYGDLETELGTSTDKESDQGKSCEDGNNSVAGPGSVIVDDLTRGLLESSVQSVVLPDMDGSDLEELDVSLSNNADSKMKTTDHIVDTEDGSTLNTSMSQSNQARIIDALEEIVADARNNKKTLFAALQSVISLMREVELKEQAAEQAIVEAAMGGTDILVKVEELKQMLQHAKEANGTHAGEVYGEKAILATELRELQSRALSLSDERDKSLAVLDEMRQTLEVRLAAAENEITSAEQEKLEKEEAAMKVLAEQELIMEKVVQESKILKQQAEENAKLQEFLMDRGHVVDMLQGEIAVICQDVRLLKEKFDENVPFSKSLSSSQTSCILASSSSSLKSLLPEQVESVPDGADSLETQKKRNSISCSDEQLSEEEVVKADRTALLDDGWEIFDNPEAYA